MPLLAEHGQALDEAVGTWRVVLLQPPARNGAVFQVIQQFA